MEHVISNLLNVPILLFFLGIIATLLKSDLEIPQPIAKFISLYLLISIGLHGGYELSKSSLNLYVLKVLFWAILMGVLVPVYT
ncbi:MAG: sodium-dependent bicarbonate transport family permease, partial [candidate division WOR-3 bacterium]|nr:sodium-dependent bicarbonate transport family permease [candidate division WOR-3 bacterium]